MVDITKTRVYGTSVQNTPIIQCVRCNSCKKTRTNGCCSCAVCQWTCHACYCDHIVRVAKTKDDKQKCTRANEHRLLTAPKHGRCYDDNAQKWILTNKSAYQRYNCCMCGEKRTRHYCMCNKQKWVCEDCHKRHVLLVCTNVEWVCLSDDERKTNS